MEQKLAKAKEEVCSSNLASLGKQISPPPTSEMKKKKKKKE
uniref:Uncharacterized protein n=1 Tax=Candidozyma auris TaxID=498019 RepID=A0A0L0P2S5_CANAR